MIMATVCDKNVAFSYFSSQHEVCGPEKQDAVPPACSPSALTKLLVVSASISGPFACHD